MANSLLKSGPGGPSHEDKEGGDVTGTPRGPIHFASNLTDGSWPLKKGRHRRFEEARALKRTNDNLDAILDARDAEPCPECGAVPGHDHSSWCMYDAEAERDESAWPS
jgi:hypothetical protein